MSLEKPTKTSPFKIRNIRLFIAFRIFFNCRFYYPVFTILFLDYGLTLQQFALLNVAWAATIVLLEVPSGALADTVGRRNLLVLTGVLMVIEMVLLCFAPRGNPGLLFAIFLVNRVLSGAAEASASGADEAIAYDTLKEEGDIKDWPRVLEKQMRVQSIAFIIAMSLGAAVYDPDLMQRMANWLGFSFQLNQDITLRIPPFLTLLMAILTLLTALRMREPGRQNYQTNAGRGTSIAEAFKLTLTAGKWILKTPFALVIILAGLLFDNCIRMIVTLNSQYYRLIELPEAIFGLIGSGLSILGLVMPRLARSLVQKHSPEFNLRVMTGITMIGLIGMTFFWPIIGLFPVILLVGVIYLQNFFQSHYLNRITSSHQRATVLSFKGLSFNFAYGVIGVLYSLLLARLRLQVGAAQPDVVSSQLENLVFIKSIAWFPGYFLLTMLAVLVFARWRLKNTDAYKKPG
ncbi:MAG: MFS transporter [Desulfobacterales bacterium]|nr:MFS transporter [Desulfobacterales bacterium]